LHIKPDKNVSKSSVRTENSTQSVPDCRSAVAELATAENGPGPSIVKPGRLAVTAVVSGSNTVHCIVESTVLPPSSEWLYYTHLRLKCFDNFPVIVHKM